MNDEIESQIDPAYSEVAPIFMVVAALLGGLMGLACGKIPMAYATERRRDGLGLGAMISCIGFGMLGGCIFALPVAMMFTVLILILGEAPGGHRGRRPELYVPWKPPPAVAQGPALAGPYTEIAKVIVCNECKQAHQRTPEGKVPPECPSCGNDFKGHVAPIPVVQPAAAERAERAEPPPERRRKLVSWREERKGNNRPKGSRVVSARQRVARNRDEPEPTTTPPPASDEIIELRPPSDDPRGW